MEFGPGMFDIFDTDDGLGDDEPSTAHPSTVSPVRLLSSLWHSLLLLSYNPPSRSCFAKDIRCSFVSHF